MCQKKKVGSYKVNPNSPTTLYYLRETNEEVVILGNFITEENLHLSNYITLPIGLFVQEKYKKLTSNDRLVYARLYNHIQLSAVNKNTFKDKKGRLFCYLTQEKIAEDLNISSRTVRTCLQHLEEVELIRREEKVVNLQKKHKIFVSHIDEGPSSFFVKEPSEIDEGETVS